jgi:hypothetical protein
MINFWNIDTLTNEEIKCLLLAFNKILQEFKELLGEFESMKKDWGDVREDVEQIKDLFPPNPKIEVFFFQIWVTEKTSSDYQKEENFIIEKEYFSIRVRDVQYRNQPIKVLRTESNGVIHHIGYCVDKVFPLETIRVPRYRFLKER